MGKNIIDMRVLTISLLFFHAKGDGDITYTTATVRGSTSAKPTTLYRRINVERSVENRSNTPLDLSRLRGHAVRRSRSEIWNWDYWCQLQPNKGDCSKNILRYHYNAQLDECASFNYTGCNGNKNSFETFVNCERHCKGSVYMSLKDADPQTICSLQPHAGVCMALFTRYYYDVNEDMCKAFVYGGCGGNDNRFETRKKCLRYCSSSNNYKD